MKNYISLLPSKSTKLNHNEILYQSKFTEDEYLNELSCQKILSILRKNYFEKAEKSSLKNYLPKIINNDINHHVSLNKKPNISLRNKSLIMSDKVRKKNMKAIELYKSNNKSSVLSKFAIDDKKDDFHYIEEYKDSRKAKLPNIVNKKVYDPFPIIYETRYIDKVEDKFIKPYFNSDNEYYTEVKKIKKSNVPFYFNINGL